MIIVQSSDDWFRKCQAEGMAEGMDEKRDHAAMEQRRLKAKKERKRTPYPIVPVRGFRVRMAGSAGCRVGLLSEAA